MPMCEEQQGTRKHASADRMYIGSIDHVLAANSWLVCGGLGGLQGGWPCTALCCSEDLSCHWARGPTPCWAPD